MTDHGPESLTLAIDEDALERLADPERVFADARGFARNVGIISTTMGYTAARRHDLDLRSVDFLTRMDRERGLEQVLSKTDTERYVYIGTDIDPAETAVSMGWEYIDVESAANDAGWECK